MDLQPFHNPDSGVGTDGLHRAVLFVPVACSWRDLRAVPARRMR